MLRTRNIIDGTERTLIDNMLDRNREALIATVGGPADADARRRLVASLTTPISLIKHAAAERIWFQRFWAGLDAAECNGYSNRVEGTFADILREQIEQPHPTAEQSVQHRRRRAEVRAEQGAPASGPVDASVWALFSARSVSGTP